MEIPRYVSGSRQPVKFTVEVVVGTSDGIKQRTLMVQPELDLIKKGQGTGSYTLDTEQNK